MATTLSLSIGSLILICLAIIIGLVIGLFLAALVIRSDTPGKREAKEQNNRIEERLTRSMHAHERIADYLDSIQRRMP